MDERRAGPSQPPKRWERWVGIAVQIPLYLLTLAAFLNTSNVQPLARYMMWVGIVANIPLFVVGLGFVVPSIIWRFFRQRQRRSSSGDRG